MTERKMLRIYDPIQDKLLWRPSWNNEIYNLYKDLNSVDEIKIIRLGWAGHVVRMEDEGIPPSQPKIKDLSGKFRNKRPMGKPRTKWEDVVRRDTSQILGIRGWRRRAEDEKEWRRLLRETKAQKGM
jgi:hypothetical protein